jgi:dienelactone hydrolase
MVGVGHEDRDHHKSSPRAEQISMHVLSLVLSALLNLAAADAPTPLAGTKPLTWNGDIPLRMVDDLHAFLDRETVASIERRARHWDRQQTGEEAFQKSIEPNRKHLAKYVGVNSEPPPAATPVPFRPYDFTTEMLQGAYDARNLELVSWRAADNVEAYAFRLLPDGAVRDQPLAVVLLDPSLVSKTAESDKRKPGWDFAKRLREAGHEVFVMTTLDRRCDLSVVAEGTRPTNQSHREFIFRQAFEMGRHPLGYEIDAVRALVGWSKRTSPDTEVGVFGFGDGGRVALLAGAIDTRIDAVGVSAAFGPSEAMWSEPIDRTIWGYLDEFGDAEVATLISPRRLVVDASETFEYAVPPDPRGVRKVAAPGTLTIPNAKDAAAEFERARQLLNKYPYYVRHWRLANHLLSNDPQVPTALGYFLGREDGIGEGEEPPRYPKQSTIMERVLFSGALETTLANLSVAAWIKHTQALVRESEYLRAKWFSSADRNSRDPEKWKASCERYRKHLYDEVLGRFEHVKLPPNARTRKIYDEPTYTGYEVVLDVFGDDAKHVDVWAYGILLVPKGLKPGERRPVVVCQHGLEGRPQMLCEPGSDHKAYHRYAGRLAELGFVTFSPQNPYIGMNHFRQLVRKLWPLKRTLWSIIVPQHEQITDWLASLEFVDGERIGFYGLSYGGKTAMRIPALVDRYCLSICSGDFNEWIRKITSVRDPFSYMGTHEYEIMEFDLGHTFNYAEMAYLIAPRPFMVERGHRDGVGIDEWVAYEYAKVQLLYADLKIPERTEIEYFDGPHMIHGVGTFDFLRRHLQWPEVKE